MNARGAVWGALFAGLALAAPYGPAPASGLRRYLQTDRGCPVTLPPPYLTQDACCGTRGPDCTATTIAYREGLRCAAATMTAARTTATATASSTGTATEPPTATIAAGIVSRETSTATRAPTVEPTPTAIALPVAFVPFALLRRARRR